jgi:hypothetical protein
MLLSLLEKLRKYLSIYKCYTNDIAEPKPQSDHNVHNETKQSLSFLSFAENLKQREMYAVSAIQI